MYKCLAEFITIQYAVIYLLSSLNSTLFFSFENTGYIV